MVDYRFLAAATRSEIDHRPSEIDNSSVNHVLGHALVIALDIDTLTMLNSFYTAMILTYQCPEL